VSALVSCRSDAHADAILWPVGPGDLAALFEMQSDPESNVMAGTEPRTREALLAASRPRGSKDADLIGIPIRITVGKKGLAEGVVELKERRSPDVRKVSPDTVVGAIQAFVHGSEISSAP